MFWIGRLNAILAIIAAVGVVVLWAAEGPAGAAGWIVLMLVLRIALRIVDVVWTATTGNPLFYHVKVLDRESDQ